MICHRRFQMTWIRASGNLGWQRSTVFVLYNKKPFFWTTAGTRTVLVFNLTFKESRNNWIYILILEVWQLSPQQTKKRSVKIYCLSRFFCPVYCLCTRLSTHGHTAAVHLNWIYFNKTRQKDFVSLLFWCVVHRGGRSSNVSVRLWHFIIPFLLPVVFRKECFLKTRFSEVVDISNNLVVFICTLTNYFIQLHYLRA